MTVQSVWKPGVAVEDLLERCPKFFTTLTAIRQFIGWLLSSPVGLLVVVTLAYVLVKTFTAIEPYSASELLLWFDGLSETFQAALAASILTVIGFLIAFQAGYANSRRDRLFSKEIEAADAIQAHYIEVSELLRNLASTARLIVRARKRVLNDNDLADVTVSVLHKNLPSAVQESERLLNLALKGFGLSLNWAHITDRHAQLPKDLDKIAEFTAKLQKVSRFAVQPSDLEDADPKEDIYWQLCDEKMAKRFLKLHKKHRAEISSGALRAVYQLYGQIAPDNFATWLNSADDWIRKKRIESEQELAKTKAKKKS